jgi:hypothetical protein
VKFNTASAAALLVAAQLASGAQTNEPRPIAAPPAFDARQLTAHPERDWITNGARRSCITARTTCLRSTSTPARFYGRTVEHGLLRRELASRGKVKAFSAKDGKPVWTFNTIPGPGEFGHDTWPQDSNAWQFGGATRRRR